MWPILHGFKDKMALDDTATVAYQAANRLFAKEIALYVRDHDSIWIRYCGVFSARILSGFTPKIMLPIFDVAVWISCE